MSRSIATKIEQWFQHADGDDDFVCAEPRAPYAVLTPGGARARVIFTTKPSTLGYALAASDNNQHIGLIGRYGLPSGRDLGWISALIGARKLLFLGDLDPPDLMIFAWLRSRLRPAKVRFLGISDELLKRIEARPTERNTIVLTPTELAAREVLPSVLPDLQQLIGPTCVTLLASGRKLELEATLGALQKSPEVFSS
ncbi:MAG: hypothetical protein K2Y37_09020 [Pirellulales bacterium]|nr:hypothetical protein [Pirellulales bacterium]